MAKKDKKSLGFNIAAFVNNSDENKLTIPATPEDNTAAPKKKASRKAKMICEISENTSRRALQCVGKS